MKVKEITRTVYVGYHDKEFLTREEAENSIAKALEEEQLDQLDAFLSEAGGPYYDFNTRNAAEALFADLSKTAEMLGLEVPLKREPPTS